MNRFDPIEAIRLPNRRDAVLIRHVEGAQESMLMAYLREGGSVYGIGNTHDEAIRHLVDNIRRLADNIESRNR